MVTWRQTLNTDVLRLFLDAVDSVSPFVNLLGSPKSKGTIGARVEVPHEVVGFQEDVEALTDQRCFRARTTGGKRVHS